MSLKAKLEAVIYAAEEPVTLAQLSQLFASDALEWQAAQRASSAELNAEVAGEIPDAEAMPFLQEGLADPGFVDTSLADVEVAQAAAMAGQNGRPGGEGAAADDAGSAGEPQSASAATEPVEAAGSASAPPAEDAGAAREPVDQEPVDQEPVDQEPVDQEAEARRQARQREREVKAVLKQILDELIAGYESDARGLEIREIAGGYRMATKPECHDAVRLFVKSLKPPLKLSLPALETLAVVAYKQPVTAPEVSEVRGVESGGVLGSLLARKLVATAGRKQVIGRPILYKTTKEFLLRFGLKDLSELPSMEEFEKMAAEIEEMEPEAVAADAAEAAAEEAAEAAGEAGDTGELDENSPSGVKLAGAAEAAPAEPAGEETRASTEAPTDATSAAASPTSNEQDVPHIEASDAPPAEPELSEPAENEAVVHAEEVEEKH